MRFIPDIPKPEGEGEILNSLAVQRKFWLTARQSDEWNLERQAYVDLDFLLDSLLEIQKVDV